MLEFVETHVRLKQAHSRFLFGHRWYFMVLFYTALTGGSPGDVYVLSARSWHALDRRG